MAVADWVERLLALAALLGGYPVPDRPPVVSTVSRDDLMATACAGPCLARGAYVPGQGVLILRTLDIDGNPRDRSVLLHELVHYLQDRYGRFATEPACRRYIDREIEAYSVQDRYLSRYNMGINLAGGYSAWMPPGCAQQAADPTAPVQAEGER
jgi:hypothetical protein